MELPHISKKQKEIIHPLIYKFRILNRLQIQKLLHHKDPKTINIWLKKLYLNKYLGRIYDPDTFGKNTKLAVYYIDNNGIRYLRKLKDDKNQNMIDNRYLKLLYSDKHAKEPFINHNIFLADIFLGLPESYTYLSKSELWEYEELRALKVDAYIKKPRARYLLHLFDSTVPRYVLEYKVKEYIKFYRSDKWKNVFVFKTFPSIIFILPNKYKLNYLKKYLKGKYLPLDLILTAKDEIKTKGFYF